MSTYFAAIHDFRGYVAVTAYNTCNDYVRGKYPSWYRLRNKLRYPLTHHPDFGLWEEADGEKICGLSEWNEQERPPNNGWINEARMDTEWYIKRGQTDDVIELLRAAFSSAKAPVRMEGLVSLVAEILNITDGPHVNHVQLEYMKPSDLPTYFVDPVDVEGRLAKTRG